MKFFIPLFFLITTSFANADCELFGNPWYNVKVTASFIDAGPPIIFSSQLINFSQVPNRFEGTFATWHQIEPVIFLEPAQQSLNRFEIRKKWVEEFKSRWQNNSTGLTSEFNRPGAFTDESSIRFLINQLNSSPSFKLEGNDYFDSIRLNYSDIYSTRKWRIANTGSNRAFSWRYDERKLFLMPNEGERPSDVKVPEPISVETDVAIYKGKPFFVTKTATFTLNQNYKRNTASGQDQCGTYGRDPADSEMAKTAPNTIVSFFILFPLLGLGVIFFFFCSFIYRKFG